MQLFSFTFLGNAASNGLPSLSGNIPFQNIGSANSQQPAVHQSRGQSSGGLNSGMLNTSSSTGNNVAPPPGFTAPHFVPQPGLQSLFQVNIFFVIKLVFQDGSECVAEVFQS